MKKKKLPKREGSVEWDLIPLYITWVAKDKDRAVYGFYRKPEIRGYSWHNPHGYGLYLRLDPAIYNLSGISWRKSLRRRPEDPVKLENVFKL